MKVSSGLLDSILTYLYDEGEGYHDCREIERKLDLDFDIAFLAYTILENDGYVKAAKSDQSGFYKVLITPSGIKFWALSGYTEQLRKENIIHEVNDSVIKTNNSVKSTNEATTNNYTTQVYLTIGNIAVASTAVIISIIALFKDDSKEIEQQNKILEQQVKILDSLSQRLIQRLPAPVIAFQDSSLHKPNP